VGVRCSKEDVDQIRSLVAEGLTSREIGAKLGRSEAGVRNIRYRLNFRRRLENNIKSLHEQEKKMKAQISELGETTKHLSDDIKSLEEKKERYESLLNSAEASIRDMIEDKLIALKIEKPQLFQITGEEQIAKLVEYFLKWSIS